MNNNVIYDHMCKQSMQRIAQVIFPACFLCRGLAYESSASSLPLPSLLCCRLFAIIKSVKFALTNILIPLAPSFYNLWFPKDCKSVQEKIAEAIGGKTLEDSDPEPSDSSTDDEDNLRGIANTQKRKMANKGILLWQVLKERIYRLHKWYTSPILRILPHRTYYMFG